MGWLRSKGVERVVSSGHAPSLLQTACTYCAQWVFLNPGKRIHEMWLCVCYVLTCAHADIFGIVGLHAVALVLAPGGFAPTPPQIDTGRGSHAVKFFSFFLGVL